MVASCSSSVPPLAVGDCYDRPESSIVLVPCDEPHRFEVYHALELPDGPFPGVAAVEAAWIDGCLAEFERFVGIDYGSSDFDVSAVFPTEETWNDLDDRRVLCAVTPLNGDARSGSAAGSRF